MYIGNNIGNYLKLYFSLLTITSLIYGIFSWKVYFYADPIYIFFIGMIITASIAGALGTIISLFHVFVSFVTIQMVGLISVMLYQGDDVFFYSGLLASAFLFLVLSSGYKQFRLLKKTIYLNEQVNDLLDNTDQGFLSFDASFKCEKSFSQECKNIFDLEDINELDISRLLFKAKSQEKELFIEGINRIIESEEIEIKELFLSLLPKEQTIQGKEIKIEYKILKNNRFMVIMTDITKTKELESKIEFQNQVQKMLITIASNRNDFLDLKASFENFLHYIIHQEQHSCINLLVLRRELHTFKGVFAQKYMIYIVKAIHELELKINLDSIDNVHKTIQEADIQGEFNKDIELIESALGKDFLNVSKTINVSVSYLEAIEESVKSLLMTKTKNIRAELNEILERFKELRYKSLKRMLNHFVSYIKQSIKDTNKEIYELEIDGDIETKIPPEFEPFIKSLVHLFNNSIDHGIENIETRISKDKDQAGIIKCSFDVLSGVLVIKISDDGAGIDTKKLSSIALDKGIVAKDELEKMSEEEQCELIFMDHVSTKDDISTTSGMGIGMSAIKDNLNKLNGRCDIENKLGEGVTFTFSIPLKSSLENIEESSFDTTYNGLSREMSEYFENTLGVKLIEKVPLNKIFIDKNYSQINFSGGFNGSIIMIFSDDILNYIYKRLIPSEFNQNDIEWLKQEIPNEILNTIAGLSIANMNDTNISIPVHIDNFELTIAVRENKHKVIKEVNTSQGKFTYILIEKDN